MHKIVFYGKSGQVCRGKGHPKLVELKYSGQNGYPENFRKTNLNLLQPMERNMLQINKYAVMVDDAEYSLKVLNGFPGHILALVENRLEPESAQTNGKERQNSLL